jgi:signal peptidase I
MNTDNDNQEIQDGQDNIDKNDEAALDEIIAEIPEIAEIKETQELVDAQYFTPIDENKRFSEELFDWIEIFSSALLTVILMFTFIFRLVTVEGPSMQETLHAKDNLIISHMLYTPKQGDIVVIQVPNSSFTTPIIKRVIATEGQTVDIDFENWIVYVDGKPVYEINGRAAIEPYVNYEAGKYMNDDNLPRDVLPLTVGQGKIFVMGDNRNHSSDSRDSRIGQVDVRNVVGRVLIRVFPFDKFGVVKPNAE